MAAPMNSGTVACLYEFLTLILDEDEISLFQQGQLLMNVQACGCVVNFPGRLQPKILNYAELTVPRYTPDEFRYHYRLSRDSYQFLLDRVGPQLVSQNKGGADPVQPAKMLLLFVWYMATPESMRETAHLFGVSISTCHSIINKVLDVIVEGANQFIKWPSEEEQELISRELQNEYVIDGAIGYIDGTHVRLNHRIKEDQDYINRKRYPSIQLQLVVAPNMKIIHATAGWPGCVNDARVLTNSDLYTRSERNELFGDGKFIIGDSAYPVRRWLISVMKDNGRLTQAQRQFNRCLSSMRQLVERVIGHLKGRFRRLRCVHVYGAVVATKIIIAACVLHNITITTQEELDDFIERDVAPDEIHGNFGIPNNNDGIALRERLIALFE